MKRRPRAKAFAESAEELLGEACRLGRGLICALELGRPAARGDRKEIADDAALVGGDLDAKVLLNAVGDVVVHNGNRRGVTADLFALKNAQDHNLQVDGKLVTGVIGVERSTFALDVCDEVIEELLVAVKELRLNAALHGGRRELKQIIDDKESDVLLGALDRDAAPAYDLGSKWRHELVPRAQVVLGLLFVGEDGTRKRFGGVLVPVVAGEQQHAAVEAIKTGVHGKRTFLDDVGDLTALRAVAIDADAVAALGDNCRLDTHLGEEDVGGPHVVAYGALRAGKGIGDIDRWGVSRLAEQDFKQLCLSLIDAHGAP